MASSTDRSEDALPRPELNPLLNPLLADNMGRWAEVYFTSPPEKREEAVLDLLRELQARNAAQTAASEVTQLPGAGPEFPPFGVGNATTERPVDMRRCDNCGQENPLRHQFCGMCGAKLAPSESEDYGSTEDIYRSPETAGTAREEALSRDYAESRALDREPVFEESVVTTEEPARDPYDLSLFQTLREKEVPRFEYQQSPSVRYRYYIGAILAILIAGLGYMAWRGTTANQDAQSTAPPPPAAAAADSTPAAASQPAAGSTPSNSPNNVEPRAAASEKRPVAPGGANPAPPPERPQPKAQEHATVPSPAAGASAERDSLAQQNSEASGADDFAMAQRYLNGSNGQGRDGAEAAKWLWRAMSKHNGPAMVALADLYLRGDGVSKNCDQARVLLDSAALRGVAGAGQRLRNLQAFGCQ